MSDTNQAAITLSQDHYLHPGATTERWWHVGTLRVHDPVIGNERTLGFEINAVGATEDGRNGDAANISQIMVIDVNNQKYYQATSILVPENAAWAEMDSNKSWSVNLGSDGGNGAIHMTAASEDVAVMTTRMSFIDGAMSTQITLELKTSPTGSAVTRLWKRSHG